MSKLYVSADPSSTTLPAVTLKEFIESKPEQKYDTITIIDKLNTIEAEVFQVLFRTASEKLSLNGTLNVLFSDIRIIADMLTTYNIRLVDAHKAIFGEDEDYRLLVDFSVVKIIAEEAGLKIKSVSDNSNFTSMELFKNV